MTKKKSKAIAVIETPTGDNYKERMNALMLPTDREEAVTMTRGQLADLLAEASARPLVGLAQDDRGLIAYNYYDSANNAQYGSETAALTQQEVMQRQEDEQRRIAALPKHGQYPDTERPHIKKFWPRLGRQE
jgi:hypothetical protein